MMRYINLRFTLHYTHTHEQFLQLTVGSGLHPAEGCGTAATVIHQNQINVHRNAQWRRPRQSPRMWEYTTIKRAEGRSLRVQGSAVAPAATWSRQHFDHPMYFRVFLLLCIDKCFSVFVVP